MPAAEPPNQERRDHESPERMIVRHQERLAAHAEASQVERVRLVKEVVTRMVEVPVTVRREVLEVESVDGREIPGLTEALSRAAVPSAAPGRSSGATPAGMHRETALLADQDGSEGWTVVLHEERVQVSTRAVPYERVRIERRTVVEGRDVTDEVRTEQVDVQTSPVASKSH